MPTPYQPPQTNHELRQTIFTQIDKLSDRSTFVQSSTTLTHLAKSLPSDHLPTFLSCILTVDSSTKSPLRVHCVHLLSVVAENHSSSTLSPHLPKILSSILKRLREPDTAVRSACAAAVSSLSIHNFSFIVDTVLQSVSTEQEAGAQSGGCACLKAAIDGGADVEGGDEVRRRVLKTMLRLVKGDGFKAKAGLMGVMASLVGVNGGDVIDGRIGGGLVGSVVSCAVEMLSSEDWGARKGGAEVLQMVAEFGSVEYLVGVKGFVVSSLESRRFDKVKGTRETMNRAWEAWKEIPGDPDEVMPLPRSNSSVSKDYGGGGGSPPLPRRSSFGGSEAYKSKKTMTKSRSSLSEFPTASISSHDIPQRKQRLSKSRSSMSDNESTITDSSSVSKSSYDFGFETPQSKKPMSKTRSSLPDAVSESKKTPAKTFDKKSRKSLEWKVKIAVPLAPPAKFDSEDEMVLHDKTMEGTTSSSEGRSNFFGSSEERIQKTGFRHRNRVNPVVEEVEEHRLNFEGERYEELDESMAESEELSLIRNQLRQIERQQSDLLDLVQRFMGKSQNGIDSLKTRVSGLERALDEISHGLGVKTGRIPDNGSTGSTCCPSTEFLSPKFWRRNEGKSSNSRSSYYGNVPIKDTNPDALLLDGYTFSEKNEGKCMNQITQRGRTCSPRSFDSTSTNAYITPVVKGA